ncbi:hypothetical protein LDENG_00159530 [Lucifuga dentata]|nr:hypothetical protein LDENG_00159530 [Lucifuga dentata]
MHYDRDKDYILKLYRQKALVFYKGSRVFIYNDYTVDVLTQRQAFSPVLKALRNTGMQSLQLRFPAKLRVEHNGSVQIFRTPVEAEKFAKTVPFRSVHSVQHISMGTASSQDLPEGPLNTPVKANRTADVRGVLPLFPGYNSHCAASFYNIFALHLAYPTSYQDPC